MPTMSQQEGKAAGAVSNGSTAAAARRAHFVFIPLMAQGHVIPVIDTALLLATHGAVCSIVATPGTAARVRPSIEQSGLDVRLLEFPLEYVSDGADNLDNMPMERLVGYFPAVALLREPIEEHLRRKQLEPRVTCIVSDFTHPWTSALAASLGVPRLSFFPTGAMCALCEHKVEKLKLYPSEEEEDAADAVVVVPVHGDAFLELARHQVPRFLRHPSMGTLGKEIDQAHAAGDGYILNTFLELEPEYVQGFAAAWGGQKVWTVAPVSLHHHQQLTSKQGHRQRGEAATIDADEYLRWLDAKDPASVVYVSFGTISPKMDPELLMELALGLELSGHPFIWVLSKADQPFADSSQLLKDLEARVAGSGQGRIVRGWVPQLLILSHAAVGCFFMHAGWNSVVEAITAGKPVVTWPRLRNTDHFVNEKLAVDVLRIGVTVGAMPSRETIQAALTAVLRGGEEGQERRRRVRELSHKATASMQHGGSSHANLCDLVTRFTV